MMVSPLRKTRFADKANTTNVKNMHLHNAAYSFCIITDPDDFG